MSSPEPNAEVKIVNISNKLNKKGGRVYRYTAEKPCKGCGALFTPEVSSTKYCSFSCRNKAQVKRSKCRPGDWLTVPRMCGECSNLFLRTKETGPNKRFCSSECSIKSIRRTRKEFYQRHPDAQSGYRDVANAKDGTRKRASKQARVFFKFPELPRACQACGEARVVELAHKPEFKRNGTWVTMNNCLPHMIWVLCPTCHKLIDRGICSPVELGLA